MSAKKTSKPIYTIVGIDVKRDKSRCWVWFNTYKKAEEQIIKYTEYYTLGRATHLIIEEVYSGETYHKNPCWYKVIRKQGKKTTAKKMMRPPRDYKRVVNFSMG